MFTEAPKTPKWSAGPQKSLGVASKDNLNAGAKAATRVSVAGDGAPLRVIYGEVVIPAQVVTVVPYQGSWIYLLCWGYGEIEGLQTLYVDDVALTAPITATHYVGNQTQNADALMVSAMSAQTPPRTYTDKLRGVAYSVVRVPVNSTSGAPRFSAKIRGLKIQQYAWQRMDPTTANARLQLLGNTVTRIRDDVDAWASVKGKYYRQTGKWYWEINLTQFTISGAQMRVGLCDASSLSADGAYVGSTANSWGMDLETTEFFHNGAVISNGFDTAAEGDLIQMGWDADTGNLLIYKNFNLILFEGGIFGNLTPAISFFDGTIAMNQGRDAVRMAFSPDEQQAAGFELHQAWYDDQAIGWTRNPANVLDDYLRNAVYGASRQTNGFWATLNAEYQAAGVQYLRDALNDQGQFEGASVPLVYHVVDGGGITLALTTTTPFAGAKALRTTDCVGGHNFFICGFTAAVVTGKLRIRVRKNGVVNAWGGAPVNGLTPDFTVRVFNLSASANASTTNIVVTGDRSTSWTEFSADIDGMTPLDYHAVLIYQDATTGNIGLDFDAIVVEAVSADPNEPRRLVDIALQDVQTVEVWTETLRTCAGCWLVTDQDGKVVQLPDRPMQSFYFFNNANSLHQSSSVRSRRNAPTVMRGSYLDQTKVPPVSQPVVVMVPGVESGTVEYRESQVTIAGITRFSQAYREMVERLNKLWLADTRHTILVRDEAAAMSPGEVTDYTNTQLGIAFNPFRIVRAGHGSLPGDYIVEIEKYDPAMYSDVVQTTPTFNDVGLPSPLTPPTIAGLTMAEELYQIQAYGGYASRARATWTATQWPFFQDYFAELYDDSAVPQLVDTKVLQEPVYASPSLEENRTYTLKLYIRSRFARSAAPGEAQVLIQGKFLPPGNVPTFSAYEAGGNVVMEWGEAIDIDIKGYEIRYRPVASGSWRSGDASVVFVNSTKWIDQGTIPPGTWTLMIKAIDSVDNESPTETEVDVVVTSDASSFLVGDQPFESLTLTSMSDEYNRVLNLHRFVTNRGELIAFGQSNPTNSAQGWDTLINDPLLTPADTGTAEYLSDSIDLGLLLAATFTMSYTLVTLSGTVAVALELSTDNTNWTAYPTGSANASARYARARFTGSSTSVFYLDGDPRLRVNAIAREETFNVRTLSSGGKLVQLANAYSVIKDVQITPVAGTDVRAVVDRLLVTPVQIDSILMHQVQLDGTGPNSYAFTSIKLGGGYVIAAGDKIKYDVWLDPRNPSQQGNGAIDINFTDSTAIRYTGTNDTAGKDATEPAYTAADAGVWISREISLTAFVGKTISRVMIAIHKIGAPGLPAGLYRNVYRNIRIVDTGGVTVNFAIYTGSGEPAENVIIFEDDVVAGTNQTGPGNTLLAYAFNGGGQVAADTFISFKGV